MNHSQTALAALGGWCLVGVCVLALLAGVIESINRRLFILSIAVIVELVLIWIYSLWRLA